MCGIILDTFYGQFLPIPLQKVILITIIIPLLLKSLIEKSSKFLLSLFIVRSKIGKT